MNKRIRIATIAALILLLVSLGSVSAVLSAPSTETRADRIVEIAEDASQIVGDLIDLVYANLTALVMIDDAGLTVELEANVTLYDEGGDNVTNAIEALGIDDYEGAIANATEALSIFREVYRSIHVILYTSDVTIGQLVDVDELEEAIDRSLARISELRAILSEEAVIVTKLDTAEELLNEAKDVFLPDNIEGAKANLREANILISEVCQYLREVAQELNPQRIRDYCDEVGQQYMERFRDGFGHAETEGIDVNGFLQTHGYQNEDDFMGRFQEMIDNAKGTEDIGDLEEIGRFIRQMDQSLTEEVGHYRASHGQDATGSDFGPEGSGSTYGQHGVGNTESGGSGQMGFGSGQ